MELLYHAIIICLVILLLWPRGYLLIYLIDRSKSFNFGFKFFAGWLIGIGGMVCDVYASNVFGGTRLLPWLFLFNSVSQIFGFGFVIFLFERKLPLPRPSRFLRFIQKYIIDFFTRDRLDQISFLVLLLVILFQVGSAVLTIGNIPVYSFDSYQNFNYKAKTIFYTKTISTDITSPFYFGGGEKVTGLNDSMLKAWLAIVDGQFNDRQINYVSVMYYLFLVAIFFFILPKDSPLHFKAMGTIFVALLPPVLYSNQNIPVGDWLLGLFLMLSFVAFWFYLRGRGASYYYFSGMALAFACWTSLEALLFVFPVMLVAKTILLFLKRVSLKDYLLDWFFAWLTIIGWISSIIWFQLDIFRFDFNWLGIQLIPSLIIFLFFILNALVSYLRKISAV